jgi:hypothetical protein
MVVLTHHAGQQRPALPRSLSAIALIMRVARFAISFCIMASTLEKIFVVCISNSGKSVS